MEPRAVWRELGPPLRGTASPRPGHGEAPLLCLPALMHVSLPGHRARRQAQGGSEPQADSPWWVSLSISCHLYFGLAAFVPSTASQCFPPLLILCLFADVDLFVHLNFQNEIYFIARSVLPV